MTDFISQEDPGDDEKYVNVNQCSAHAAQQQRDIDEEEIDEEEKQAIERMMIIMRNGNSGEHYEQFNDSDIHPYF